MKKQLLIITVICLLLAGNKLFAQRYFTEIFSSTDSTQNIVYGQNYVWPSSALIPLKMDVYEPTGDTASVRPLIIMMHAGSFLPPGGAGNQLPFGTKSDSCMVEMCQQFAKRGWVAVSMDYRLGWNPLAADQEGKAKTIIQAVYRSMQDAKTCIRYFKKDAVTSNTFKIDTNKIVLGGSNSGGYTALAAAALNDTMELKYFKFLDSLGNSFVNIATLGNLDGFNGTLCYNNHPGYTSNFHMALNLGGAMGDTLWQETGEMPMVAFHGASDALTPYNTQVVIVAAPPYPPIIEVSGSGHFMRTAKRLGNQAILENYTYTDPYSIKAQSYTNIEGLFPFYGPANGFEPWAWYDSSNAYTDHTTPGATGFGSKANPFASKAKALVYIDTIMNYFVHRANQVLNLTGDVGINEVGNNANFTVYPNPASDAIYLVNKNSNDPVYSIEIYDMLGKRVYQNTQLNISSAYKVDRNDLPSGLYFVTARSKQGTVTKKIIFE
jgi:dienelactone hydrolase